MTSFGIHNSLARAVLKATKSLISCALFTGLK